MPFHLGVPELIIVLFIVLLIFGAGRLGQIGGDLGRGIREFRHEFSEHEGQQKKEKVENAKP